MADVFDLNAARSHLQSFAFKKLFLGVLHWNAPSPGSARPLELLVDGQSFVATPIAEQASVRVFEVVGDDTLLQSKTLRVAVAKALRGNVYESFIIFRDEEKRGCVWNWLRTEGKKTTPREHYYFRWQPGDLFLQKISRLFVDLAELDDEGSASFTAMLGKIEAALDTQAVTKKFFTAFQGQYASLLGSISGIREEKDRRWFTSLLLNRLMFVAFLEAKGFLEGDREFLQRNLNASVAHGKDRYYKEFLQPLFFEAFATPNTQARSARARKLFSKIRYLNGGLFVKHRLERDYEKTLRVPDAALGEVLGFFHSWTWTLDDRVGAKDDTINPDVLGHIFERYNNARQKEDGAYYTPPDITNYLAERTIGPALLARLDGRFESIDDLYAQCDAATAEVILRDVLPTFRVIDPACGSGAFLLAAFRTLQEIYGFVLDIALRQPKGELREWANELVQKHGNRQSTINERIVTQNLYGVELNQEATEVARLRMFLELIAPAQAVEEIQPLPNLEYNIMQGNSLIGFREQPDTYERLHRQHSLIRTIDYREVIEQKDESLVAHYKTVSHKRLRKHATKGRIERSRERAKHHLDTLLAREFDRLRIKVLEQVWDPTRKKTVTANKRSVTLEDLQGLTPFHWDYEFRDVFADGGFDVVITNPPWEVIQTDEKEFFSRFDASIKKKTMSKKSWDDLMPLLLNDGMIREAWEKYATAYTFQAPYFKVSSSALQPVSSSGATIPTKNDSYKVFLARCRNLLRDRGDCGVVIPSGIYTDLGAKGLREMLFEQTHITGLFGFENRREIFENVHRSFKFVVLTFELGGTTNSFPTAFMRHDTAEIRDFPERGAMDYPLALVKTLSPESLSLVELKSKTDLRILERAALLPLLGTMGVSLADGLNVTTMNKVFLRAPSHGSPPLYEGKMISCFQADLRPPQYWVPPEFISAKDQYRVVFRKLARNTDKRTLISTVLPGCVAIGSNLIELNTGGGRADFVLAALLNAFTVDYLIRLRVTACINHFYLEQVPVPNIALDDEIYAALRSRVARLVSLTPAYEDLAVKAGLSGWRDGVTDPRERLRLRGEIDAIVAHLYGLTGEEYDYILSTFPLVPDTEKAVMRAMFAVLPLRAVAKEGHAALDLTDIETVSHSVDVEAALKACLDAGERERASRTTPRQLKAA